MPLKLGELLLKENMVTPQQLQEALDHQKASGGPLDKAFVSLGFLQDEDIRGCLSRQLGLPSINLDHFEVDPAIIKIIPAATARKYRVLPLSQSEKNLALAMADPTNLLAIDDIRFMTGFNVEPIVVREAELEEAIHRYYGSSRASGTRNEVAPLAGGSVKEVMSGPRLSVDDMATIGGLSEIDLDSMSDAVPGVESDRSQYEEIDLSNLAKSAATAPVMQLANVLFVDSVKRGAYAIHIELYEKEFRIRFRIGGVLQNVMTLPMKLRDPLISRIKSMAKLKSGEKRFLQDGRIRIRMKVEDRSRDVDFLVRCMPTLRGEKIVIRILDLSNLILDLTKLGFEPQSLERFKNAIAKPYGIVLVTGPTGAGSKQTLYAALAALNKPDCNIMTVEDPVEFTLPGINQVEVNEDDGASIVAVLRSFRRLDPDVVAVGEIRDVETMEVMVDLALKGILLLAIWDTNDAASTVARMVNSGIEPFRLATAVNLIEAQRPVRRVCSKCKTDITAEVPSETLADIGFKPDEIGTFQVMKGKGCPACYGTGYKGHVRLYEVMEFSEGIRNLLLAGTTTAEIKKKALEEGMISLRMSGLEKIKEGITTVEEVLRETVL